MRMGVAGCALAFAVSANAYNACVDVSRAQFARDLAAAHAADKLATLDQKYPGLGGFQVYLEHSLGSDAEGDFVVFGVASFRELAQRLKARRVEDRPWPQSRPLRKCANGICSYNFYEGIDHGYLYLKEIRYNDYVGCLDVEAIWFLDGD